MTDQPSCPHCREIRLFHTGALWMCPRCGLMITKHALAAETDRDRPASGVARADDFEGRVTD